jgi:hypothetical protein
MYAYSRIMLIILIWSDKVRTEPNLQSHMFQVWSGLPDYMEKFINDQLVKKYYFIVRSIVSLPSSQKLDFLIIQVLAIHLLQQSSFRQ